MSYQFIKVQIDVFNCLVNKHIRLGISRYLTINGLDHDRGQNIISGPLWYKDKFFLGSSPLLSCARACAYIALNACHQRGRHSQREGCQFSYFKSSFLIGIKLCDECSGERCEGDESQSRSSAMRGSRRRKKAEIF